MNARPFALLALATTALFSSSCATVQSASMVPEPVEVRAQHVASLSIKAQGTPRSAFVGRRLVSSEQLADALSQAIGATRMFAEINPVDAPAEYQLSVRITEIDRSEASLDMETTVRSQWTLTDLATSEELWSEEIDTAATVGPEGETELSRRTRMSLEEALRKNLARGIVRLGSINL